MIRGSCAALALLLVGCMGQGAWRQEVGADPGNRVDSIQRTGDGVEIAVSSQRLFPVRNDYPVLIVGPQHFDRSRYPASGDTHILVFALTAPEYDRLQDGDPVTVRYSTGAPPEWRFGRLEKRRLGPPN